MADIEFHGKVGKVQIVNEGDGHMSMTVNTPNTTVENKMSKLEFSPTPESLQKLKEGDGYMSGTAEDNAGKGTKTHKSSMSIITGPRMSGKTYNLIQQAHDSGGYIVCRGGHAGGIAQAANLRGLSINYPISYKAFIAGRFYNRGIKCFLFDDVSALLRMLAKNIPIHAITVDTTDAELLNLEGAFGIDPADGS